jgi:ABC-type nitrate/sulfonate/bicarbonate transport system ATPase subunit
MVFQSPCLLPWLTARQNVALAAEPGCLLLDDPFSVLDSLTRVGMQDLLLRVWEHSGRTVVMVTHDVDEALYLADRLILMTDGPAAAIGETMTVPFERPRCSRTRGTRRSGLGGSGPGLRRTP